MTPPSVGAAKTVQSPDSSSKHMAGSPVASDAKR